VNLPVSDATVEVVPDFVSTGKGAKREARVVRLLTADHADGSSG
jgi:hypothetical protein